MVRRGVRKTAKVKLQKRSNCNSKSGIGFLLSDNAYDMLCIPGYTSLDKCPEVMTAARRIAETISMMTIQIFKNEDEGDVRIIDELSRKIDINPCEYLTRKTWMEAIIMNLLLYGNGNSVVQVSTRNGFLESLEPIPSQQVSFYENGRSYYVKINGVDFSPDEILHFVQNPDPYYPWKGRGVSISLKEIANLVRQGRHTEKGFLENPKPSIIVKVDAMTDEFSSKKGREKLLEEYVKSTRDGDPWMIPAEQFEIEQVKPFTLSDLAIADNMKINKELIASIFGMPAFLLGVGEYKKEAWNNFINTTIKTICIGIQQELTKKLIISPERYIKFNYTSLLDWDLATISSVYGSLSDRGFVTGNEVRDKIGMSPRKDLDELRVLENYIPVDKTGLQKKLKGSDEDE